MLTGTVPPSFAIKKLAKLILNENDLTGRFFPDADAPHLAILAEVNLASNLLTGTLHRRTISRMTELDLLSLSENDLSGLVPGKQLGGLPHLEYLYLDSNHFVGPLPAKLAQVGKAGLKELWLQMNDFSGTVPVSYVRFDHLVDFYIDGNKVRIHYAEDRTRDMKRVGVVGVLSLRSLSIYFDRHGRKTYLRREGKERDKGPRHFSADHREDAGDEGRNDRFFSPYA